MTKISRTLLPVNSLKIRCLVALDSRTWESFSFFLDVKQHSVPNSNDKIRNYFYSNKMLFQPERK